MDKPRSKSLDVFRGLTVAFMIVVNTSGPGAEPFVQLSHAKWFGLTLADWRQGVERMLSEVLDRKDAP